MTDAQFYNNFVFRKFEYNRYHTTDATQKGAPHHYFAKLLNGRAKLQCAKFTVDLVAGDVFYIPYGMHYISHWYPENGSVCFYSFGFSHLPSAVDYKMQKIECDSALFDAMTDNITVSADSIARLYGFFARIKDLMIPRCTMTQDIAVMRATDYMRKHPDASAGEIAEHLSISESGLYNIFKITLNKTPLEIKRAILIEHAEELLLTTDLPIEEISDRLGFSSSSYFRKVLRKETGLTPTAIRKSRI